MHNAVWALSGSRLMSKDGSPPVAVPGDEWRSSKRSRSVFEDGEGGEVSRSNITNNVDRMARFAGIGHIHPTHCATRSRRIASCTGYRACRCSAGSGTPISP
jgi:hypothetical protein